MKDRPCMQPKNEVETEFPEQHRQQVLITHATEGEKRRGTFNTVKDATLFGGSK